MSKCILGLDLGTNSIGWAVVNEIGGTQFELIKKGSHVFPEAVADASQSGARKSKAAERREKRGARRLNYRRKIRKINTLKVLIEHKMCPGITKEDLNAWRYERKYPENEAFRNWQNTNDLSEKNEDKIARNPYLFRFEAIDRKFDEKERQKLGRAFYHMAQRRGFKSNSLDGGSDDAYDAFHESLLKEFNQKHDSIDEVIDILTTLTEGESDQKSKKLKNRLLKILKKASNLEDAVSKCVGVLEKPEFLGKVKRGIHDLDLKIQDSGARTLGEYFFRCYEKGEKIRGHYTDRENHYEKEFNEICRVQGILQESDLYKDLHDAIFYQRPLRSQKGLVANCSLEFRLPVFKDGEPLYLADKLVTYSKRCVSVSHPIFEEFRMRSFINQIKWKKAGESQMSFLSAKQKDEIEYLFYRKSKPYFKFSEITKKLFGKNSLVERVRDEGTVQADYFVNYALDTSVSGCPVIGVFRKCFGENYQQTLDESYLGNRENKNGNKKTSDDILTEAWGILFSREDSLERKRQLIKKWTVSEETAKEFSEIKLPPGYASLSLAAVRKIVPLLKEGMIYSHAVLFANLPAVLRTSGRDPEEIKKELSGMLDVYSDHRKQVAIANELIADSETDESLMNELKWPAEFEKKVGEKFVQKFGSSVWNKMTEDEQEDFSLKVVELLKTQNAVQNDEGRWVKLVPLKGMLNDILINTFKVSKERAMLLYHPSDILKHNPYRKSETGLLESPIVSSIKNPVFMRTMHRLKAVVNALIQDGTISDSTEIHVEMARELNTANMRAVIEAENKKREERRKKYAKIVKNLMGVDATETDLLKFKLWEELTPEDSEKDWIKLNEKIEEKSLKYELWEEQKRICPYTGKTIGLADFLSDDPAFEIEHILPRSRSYDNSEENLTLCCKDYNRKVKKDKIPFECDNHKEILPRIEHWKKRAKELDWEIKKTISAARNADPERKAKIIQKRHRLKFERDHYAKKYERFTMKEVPNTFANRQLNDTRIITKYACLYLKSVFKKVMTVNGLTVAELRKQWGLQHDEKKSREKHTHHCIDAIVIACMTKGQYDQLAHFYTCQENEKFKHGNPVKPIPQPWANFIPSIKQLEEEVLVSHYAPNHLLKQTKKCTKIRGKKLLQQGKTARGRLHKDTFYGAIKRQEKNKKGDLEETIKYVVRKPLADLSEADRKKIVDDRIREIALEGLKKEIALKKDLEKLRKQIPKVDDAEELIIKEQIKEIEKQLDTLYLLPNKNGKPIPIKKVRIYTKLTNPIPLKKQRDVSEKRSVPYKEKYYVNNDGNYLMAIYEGVNKKDKITRKYKLLNNLASANGASPEESFEGLHLLKIIKTGQLVLLFKENPSELMKMTQTELSQRLYIIRGLDDDGIKLYFNQEARMTTDVITFMNSIITEENRKNGVFDKNGEVKKSKLTTPKGGDVIDKQKEFPYIKFKPSRFNVLVNETDFKMNILGEIEFLKK